MLILINTRDKYSSSRNPVHSQSIDLTRIPSSVVERLGWYVYAYVHRRDRRIHYIGKGKGQRVLAHLLRFRRHRVDLVAHGLPDEATAFLVERAPIDGLGLERLRNKVSGKGKRLFGREPLVDLIYRCGAQRINIEEPAVLIRLNHRYRPGMPLSELYEATRGVWKIGPRRTTIEYAFAVYRGIVREVYRIRSWHRGGTTRYRYRRPTKTWRRRWEFVGEVASQSIRQRYVGGSVEHLLPDGAQYPIRYVHQKAAA